MPQPDLVLLLVWVQEEVNVYTSGTNANARAANGDTATHSLPPTTHIHAHIRPLSSTANCDDDSYLDAYLSGYGRCHDATLSGGTHRQNPCLTASDRQRISGCAAEGSHPLIRLLSVAVKSVP